MSKIIRKNDMLAIWPMLLNYSPHDCLKILRRLELEAYGKVVTVFRAQGPLTEEKKKLLNKLQLFLSISVERHKAEVRRALNDEELATISEAICGKEVDEEWILEGKRISPIFHRPSPETIYLPQANKASSEQFIQNCAISHLAENPQPLSYTQPLGASNDDSGERTHDSMVTSTANKSDVQVDKNDSVTDSLVNNQPSNLHIHSSTVAVESGVEAHPNCLTDTTATQESHLLECEKKSSTNERDSSSKKSILTTTVTGSVKICSPPNSIITQVVEDPIVNGKSKPTVSDLHPRPETGNQYYTPPTQFLLNHQPSLTTSSIEPQQLTNVTRNDADHCSQPQHMLTSFNRVSTMKSNNPPNTKSVSAITAHILTSNANTTQCGSPLVVQMHKPHEDANIQRFAIMNATNPIFVPDKCNVVTRINNNNNNSNNSNYPMNNHSVLHTNKLNHSRTTIPTKEHILNVARPNNNNATTPHSITNVPSSIPNRVQHQQPYHYTNSIVLPNSGNSNLTKFTNVSSMATTTTTTTPSNAQQILKTVLPIPTSSSIHSASSSSLVVGSVVNVRSDVGGSLPVANEQPSRIQWSSGNNNNHSTNSVCLNTFTTTTNANINPVTLNTVQNSGNNNVILFHKGVVRKMVTATNPQSIRISPNLNVANQTGSTRTLPVISNNNVANRQIRILGLANTKQSPNLIQQSTPIPPHSSVSDFGFVNSTTTLGSNLVITNVTSNQSNQNVLSTNLPTHHIVGNSSSSMALLTNSRLGAILEVDLDSENYSEQMQSHLIANSAASIQSTENLVSAINNRSIDNNENLPHLTEAINQTTTTPTTTGSAYNLLESPTTVGNPTTGCCVQSTLPVESLKIMNSCELVRNLITNDACRPSVVIGQKRPFQDSSEFTTVRMSVDSQLIQDCDRDNLPQTTTAQNLIITTHDKPSALDAQFQPNQTKRFCTEFDTATSQYTIYEENSKLSSTSVHSQQQHQSTTQTESFTPSASS